MKKNRKGFTLVEIIVVLLIIGILLAITIPSIMGYVSDARDAQLLTEARNVLLAAKTKGTILYTNNEIGRIENDPTIAKEIIKESEIDGILYEIEMNEAKNSSGNFILGLSNKYVYYDDGKQQFEVKSELVNTMGFVKRLNKQLQSIALESLLKGNISITQYLNTKSSNLDSEGPNFGIVLKKELQKLGFNPETYSMVLYKKDNKFNVIVTEKKLTLSDANQRVEVTKYSYAKNSFEGTPTVSNGTVTVGKSSVDSVDNPTLSKNFPILNINTFKQS